MTERTLCPRCSFRLIAMERPYDAAHVQRLLFCHRCRFEEIGDIVPGQIEVDDGWSLHVSTPGPPSADALRALRAVPDLVGVPLGALARRLKDHETLVLGPFIRSTAVEIRDRLRATGLVVDLDERTDRLMDRSAPDGSPLDSPAIDQTMRTEVTIRNCTVRLDDPCPRRWEELQPTETTGVRHCSVCAREVFFCSSAEETLAHARAGHCIAREGPRASALRDLVLGRPKVVPVVTTEQERAQQWARRERGIDVLLRGRLEAASRPCPGCGYPVPDFRKSCYVCGLEIGRA